MKLWKYKFEWHDEDGCTKTAYENEGGWFEWLCYRRALKRFRAKHSDAHGIFIQCYQIIPNGYDY